MNAHAQLKLRLAALEAQLARVRQKGGDRRVEDQIREEIERYKQAISYVK